jgi:hypothetical protein
MSICPSCNQSTSDDRAAFCARCGFALPAGAGGESLPASFAAAEPLSPSLVPAGGWLQWPGHPTANPKAVAVGLGALLAAFITAIVLSYGSAPSPHEQDVPAALAPRNQQSVHRTSVAATAEGFERSWWKLAAAPFEGRLGVDVAAAAPLRHMRRYRASGYALAYPSGWLVSRGDQPVGSYRETVLESNNGAAKVTVDYSPGESIDPAAKAAGVESATSRTPGYRRISFGPTTVDAQPAFAWEFTVADADPRRADLFIATPSGGFALLAHGLDLVRARSAARSIAGALIRSP